MSVLDGLKPQAVWQQFEAICNIPHPSKHEAQIAAYVMEQAKQMNLTARQDEVGNVLVTKPATPGYEKVATLVLQGHLDMVPVAAPGVEHDFTKDPIKLKIEGDYVRAQGTTLGADNGIGVAMMLAVMAEKFEHGELECLFTVNEESGMSGAHGLQADFLKGRQLLNLDTEDWGEFYISCAGGGDSIVHLPIARTALSGEHKTVKIEVGGLKGGHSGVDINLGRGSATRIIGRLLAAGYQAVPFLLRQVNGGNKRNSIADWATAVLEVPNAQYDTLVQAVNQLAQDIKEELSQTDPGLSVTVTTTTPPAGEPLTSTSTRQVIDLMIALPQGVLAMNAQVPDLVECSTNQGVITTHEHELVINLLTRSAVNSKLDAIKTRIRTIASLVNAKVEEPRGYPGWKPNMDSRLLRIGQEVYQRLYQTAPAVKAVHAGLECGIFSVKLPGVDMLSIGPTVHNPHSPDEELLIPTVGQCYDFLLAFITELAKADQEIST